MGREIKEMSSIVQDRINRLRRLKYFLDNQTKINEEVKDTIDNFLDTNLALVEFELFKAMLQDNTPIDALSDNRLRTIAKALGVPRYRYLTRQELLVLIEKEGEVYGTTYSHPNAASKRTLRRICARDAKNLKNKVPEEG